MDHNNPFTLYIFKVVDDLSIYRPSNAWSDSVDARTNNLKLVTWSNPTSGPRVAFRKGMQTEIVTESSSGNSESQLPPIGLL